MNDATRGQHDDERLRAAYQAARARREPATRDGCATPEALAAVVEREGSEEARLATLDHAMACAACARDLELLRAARVAAHAAQPRPWQRAPLLAAASLLITVGAGAAVWMNAPSERADVLRGGDQAITVVAPSGAVPRGVPPTFVWHAVPGAAGYVVEVLDTTGAAVWSARTADTVLATGTALAAPLAPNAYDWWVRAELLDGGARRSAATRFTVPAP